MDREVIRFRAYRRLLRYLLGYSFCRTRYARRRACRDSASAGLCGTTYEVMLSPSLERENFDENPMFKDWGRSRNPSRVLAAHSFLRCSYQLPISMIDSSAEAGVRMPHRRGPVSPEFCGFTMAKICRIRESRRSLERPSNQRNQSPSGPDPSNKRMIF